MYIANYCYNSSMKSSYISMKMSFLALQQNLYAGTFYLSPHVSRSIIYICIYLKKITVIIEIAWCMCMHFILVKACDVTAT